MIIKVKVVPNSDKSLLLKKENENYVAYVDESARRGKANISLVKLLAKEFKVLQNKIIIKNQKSRIKIVEIKL